MAITITNITATTPTSVGGTDGALLFDVTATGGSGTAGLSLLVYRVPDGTTSGGLMYGVSGITPGPLTAPNLPAGTYTLVITEVGSSATTSETAIVPAYTAPAVPGCTDPSADNYDPDATEDDGSCAYTAPTRTPYFNVPLGQSLRFVRPELAELPAVDNALLANSAPDGDTNPGYCQLVERGDTLVLQYQSNYMGTATVRLVPAVGSAISFTPAKVVIGAGTSPIFDAYARVDSTTGYTRIYFNNDALPLPLLPGARVTLVSATTLNGTFPVADVREDPAAAVPYLLLNTAYPGGAQRIDLTLTTPYALQAFDTWQVVLPFSAVPAGEYQCIITVTDTDFGTTTAESEPLDVAATHRNTLVLAYRNFDNAFDLNYTAGLVNRLRLKARLFERQTETQKTTLRGSDNRLTLLTADAQRKLPFTVYLAPGWLHEVIALALCHDFVRVDGIEVVTEGKYEYPPTPRYTLSSGTALLEQANFLQGNRDDVGDTDRGTLLLVNDNFLKVDF